MKNLYIQILNKEIKTVSVEDSKKTVVLGVFSITGKSQTAFKNEVSRIKKELKLKQDPTIILPEPGLYPNSQNWKLSKDQTSSIMARASYEAHRGQFKKQGVYILLEIGNSINLAVIRKNKQININEHNLDRMVADFHEAISEPHDSRYLQDFCTNHFFLKKRGKTGPEIYNQMQDDALDGAELFVEYGANMGALLANLDTLFEPDCIAISGSLVQTFDAWSHAMGKMRNQHRGKKPTCRVTPLENKSDSSIIGANYLNL